MQHAGVARQNLSNEPAHAAAHRVLYKASLQSCSHTASLPLRRNHEGHFSEIGRGTQKIAGAADDLLVLAWPADGKKRDLGLMVYVTQCLQLQICKRTHTP